eukprot:5020491-Alexandrium_andersonii.AAC.1
MCIRDRSWSEDEWVLGPILKAFPEKVPSVYVLADIVMRANEALGGMWLRGDRQVQIRGALQEAD